MTKSGKLGTVALDGEDPVSIDIGGIYTSVDETHPLTLGRTSGNISAYSYYRLQLLDFVS